MALLRVPQQTVAQQVAVSCPICGADAREPCITLTGHEVTKTIHRARKRLASFKRAA